MSSFEYINLNLEYVYQGSGSHTDACISENLVRQDPIVTIAVTTNQDNRQSTVEIDQSTRDVVDTSIFSVEQRLLAAVWVHERKALHMSVPQIKRKFREHFGRSPPTKKTLLAWEQKLFTTGSICDAPRSGRPSTRQKHVAAVLESLRTAPGLSQRARASALQLPRTTLRAILHSQLPKPHTTSNRLNKRNSVHAQSNKSICKKKIKTNNNKE